MSGFFTSTYFYLKGEFCFKSCNIWQKNNCIVAFVNMLDDEQKKDN